MAAKIRLGPAGNCLTAEEKGTLGSLKQVARLGLNAQEIEFVRFVYMNQKAAEEAGALAKQLGIELSVHASYFINLCGDERTVKKSKDLILLAADRAARMGAEIVVFHPGYYGKIGQQGQQRAMEVVAEALKDLRKKMPPEVLLGPESAGKITQFGSLEELISLSAELGGVAPVIDFAHIYARQQGRIDYAAVFDALKRLRLKHIHSHFTGVAWNERGERHHLTIDSRQPDFLPLAKEILRRELDITIISESPVLEKDALVMRRALEREGHKF